jgi:hypothetical protein
LLRYTAVLQIEPPSSRNDRGCELELAPSPQGGTGVASVHRSAANRAALFSQRQGLRAGVGAIAARRHRGCFGKPRCCRARRSLLATTESAASWSWRHRRRGHRGCFGTPRCCRARRLLLATTGAASWSWRHRRKAAPGLLRYTAVLQSEPPSSRNDRGREPELGPNAAREHRGCFGTQRCCRARRLLLATTGAKEPRTPARLPVCPSARLPVCPSARKEANSLLDCPIAPLPDCFVGPGAATSR